MGAHTARERGILPSHKRSILQRSKSHVPVLLPACSRAPLILGVVWALRPYSAWPTALALLSTTIARF